MVEYFSGSAERNVVIRGLGNLTMYPGYLESPAAGAKARVVGMTPLGSKYKLLVSAQVRSEPFFTAGVDDARDLERVAGAAGVTPSVPVANIPRAGLFERRSFVSSNKGYLTREWGRRDKTVLSYLFFAQRFSDNSGNNSYHEAGASYQRTFSRTVAMTTAYRYLNGTYTSYGGATRPLVEHRIQVGPDVSRRLGRARVLSVSFGAGAAYIQTEDTSSGQPYDTVAPYASAAAAIDLTRTWKLHGGYGRSYSVLQGLTGEIYAADAANLAVGGRLTSRSDMTVGGGLANGRTLIVSGVGEDFRLYSVTVQLRTALTSTLGATAGYYFYSQNYSDPTALPQGFPATYSRNALMLGLTYSSSGQMRGPLDW